MEKRRILISLAHPDDESFGYGGLISKYVHEGAEVYLICATNGDVGTISPELLNGYSSHAELRLAELDCASEILGFTDVFKFGYRDSGMVGTAENEHPDCLWYEWTHNPGTVTRRVVEVIRQVKPQVVLTFNRYGGYGHPDHIAIQRATTEAFDLAGDTTYLTDGLPAYQPQKLYYSSIPSFWVRMRIWRSRLKGDNPRQLGRNKDIDMLKILEHVEPAHTRIDIGDYLDDWAKASACHISQGGGSTASTPKWLLRLMSRNFQRLTRIHPAPPADMIDEDDVFANVKLEASHVVAEGG